MHILYGENSPCFLKLEGKFEQSIAESGRSAEARILSGLI